VNNGFCGLQAVPKSLIIKKVLVAQCKQFYLFFSASKKNLKGFFSNQVLFWSVGNHFFFSISILFLLTKFKM